MEVLNLAPLHLGVQCDCYCTIVFSEDHGLRGPRRGVRPHHVWKPTWQILRWMLGRSNSRWRWKGGRLQHSERKITKKSGGKKKLQQKYLVGKDGATQPRALGKCDALEGNKNKRIANIYILNAHGVEMVHQLHGNQQTLHGSTTSSHRHLPQASLYVRSFWLGPTIYILHLTILYTSKRSWVRGCVLVRRRGIPPDKLHTHWRPHQKLLHWLHVRVKVRPQYSDSYTVSIQDKWTETEINRLHADHNQTYL